MSWERINSLERFIGMKIITRKRNIKREYVYENKYLIKEKSIKLPDKLKRNLKRPVNILVVVFIVD